MTDPATGLDAKNALLDIAAKWALLHALVAGGGGRALTGMPTGDTPNPIPIDVTIVDLMTDVEEHTRFYAQVLLDEVPTRHGCGVTCATVEPPRTADQCPDRIYPIHDDDTPGLLRQIADRYGHFLNHELEEAFIDDAIRLHGYVRKTVAPPAPPVYVGPCPTFGCDGELRLRDNRDAGMCPKCGAGFDRASHEAWLAEQMNERLMTQTELVTALKTLGTPVTDRTIRRWVAAGKLTPVEEGLYRLAQAINLAPRKAAA